MSDVSGNFLARLASSGPFLPQPVPAADRYSFADDFDCLPSISTLATTGQLINTGAGAWWAQALSGSPATQLVTGPPVPQPNHPGTLRLRTSSTINAGLAIKRAIQNSATATYIRVDKIQTVTVWFAVPVVTNIRLQIGIDSEPSTSALTEGALLILDTNQSANFLFSAAQSGQVQTFDSGIRPVASSPNAPIWWRFDIVQETPSIFQFQLNEEAIGEIDRSAFPPGSTNVGCMVQALTASQPEVQLDYFSVSSRELDRYAA